MIKYIVIAGNIDAITVVVDSVTIKGIVARRKGYTISPTITDDITIDNIIAGRTEMYA